MPEYVKVTNKSIQALVEMKKLIDSGESDKRVECRCCLFSQTIDNKLSISVTKPPLILPNDDTSIVDNE